MDQVVETLGPEIGVLGAFTIGGLILIVLALWYKLSQKDARIKEITDARIEDQKLHTQQLVESTSTVKSTLDMLQRLGVDRV